LRAFQGKVAREFEDDCGAGSVIIGAIMDLAFFAGAFE